MEPVIKQVASLLGLTLDLLDADEEPAIVASLGVSSLPTTILMENDVEIVRFSGCFSLPKTLSQLEI